MENEQYKAGYLAGKELWGYGDGVVEEAISRNVFTDEFVDGLRASREEMKNPANPKENEKGIESPFQEGFEAEISIQDRRTQELETIRIQREQEMTQDR